MLRRKDKRSEVFEAEEKVLEIDANMQGTLSFKDPVNIVINGKFDGTLETLGTLTIGEQAIVKAKIKGETVILKGELTGDVEVSRSLELHSEARLTGDIQTPRLSIQGERSFKDRSIWERPRPTPMPPVKPKVFFSTSTK